MRKALEDGCSRSVTKTSCFALSFLKIGIGMCATVNNEVNCNCFIFLGFLNNKKAV